MYSSDLLFQVSASPFLCILLVLLPVRPDPAQLFRMKMYSYFHGKTPSVVASGQLGSVPVAPILEAGED